VAPAPRPATPRRGRHVNNNRLSQLREVTRDTADHLRHLDVSGRLTEHIDAKMLEMARQIGGTSTGDFFESVSEEYLRAEPRPDAVDHHAAYLHANPISTADQRAILGIVDVMQGEQVAAITDRFAEFARDEKLFERVEGGAKYIFPSNHLALPDQGFTLGYFHKAAHATTSIDRLEHYISTMVGRLLGYYEVGGLNVIDGILRKAGGVLKTFPISGGETLDESLMVEGDLDPLLRLFRKVCNHQTKREFERLMHASTGHIVLLAGGGSHDTVTASGDVEMHPFGRTTREMIARDDPAVVVVPLFVDYGPDASLVDFGTPRNVAEPDDVHAVGVEIAGLGNRQRGQAALTHPEVERFAGTITYEA
jgi:hypothetical protein